eukprot:Pompholyxophrys_punicea_v1_NODE_282_length_2394_cov_66.752458.p2 type:complete len:156 gc:universal NODE_282_length_2394_cov_66.752458:1402-935(-)
MVDLDLPARAVVLNCKQYNGDYGCGFCYDKGCPKSTGKGHVYPFTKGWYARTHESWIDDIFDALREKGSCNVRIAFLTCLLMQLQGVKGPTRLMNFPGLNLVRGVPVDYMHSVCLGVVKYILRLWFESCNHKAAYYQGKILKEVDERLLKFKVIL